MTTSDIPICKQLSGPPAQNKQPDHRQGRILNVSLNLNEECNFKCTYCYIKKRPRRMSWRVAKRAVDFSVSFRERTPVLSFVTAEPLLRWNFVKRVIAYAEAKGIQRFDLATNGSLLNEAILRYCDAHNVVLQISFDGQETIHDRVRIHEHSQHASRLVASKLFLLKKIYKRHLEIRVTVVPETASHLFKTMRFLAEDFDYPDMRINIVPVVDKKKWYPKNVSCFEHELLKIADLFLRHERMGHRLNICSSECFPPPNHLVNIHKFLDSQKMFCNVGHEIISIDIDGKIWPCYWLGASRFPQKEELCLGHIFGTGISWANLPKIASPPISPFLSCRVWNFLLAGKSTIPLEVYKEIFRCWERTSAYVHRHRTLAAGRGNSKEDRKGGR